MPQKRPAEQVVFYCPNFAEFPGILTAYFARFDVCLVFLGKNSPINFTNVAGNFWNSIL